MAFQEYNKDLANRLQTIFKTDNDNILIGISRIYFYIELNKYIDTIYDFLFTYIAKEHRRLLDMIDNSKQYVSA
ncbi:MAG: GT-D fold domain-containing protein [Mucispirillum sp.]|nr:GT-D fold domain-containing protein [Mucispirillum sp.]